MNSIKNNSLHIFITNSPMKLISFNVCVLFGGFLWSLINVNLHLRTDNKIGLDTTSIYSKTPRFHITKSYIYIVCTISNSWYITNSGAHTYITCASFI